MIQTRRINFQGTDQEYIVYLERLVLEKNSTLAPSLPSPPLSYARDDAIESSDNDELSSDNIDFIFYEPETPDGLLVQPRKRRRAERRWEREMDEMISDLTTEDWASRRKTIGLSSHTGIFVALDVMMNEVEPRTILNSNETEPSTVSYHSSNPVLQLLNSFATTTAALKVQQAFTTQIFHFRVFVFVSLCCVALQNGTDQALVDKTMQICISDSSTKNLARLRNGALWVNQVMVELAADGHGYLAYELFLLWGQSIAKYGSFADAGAQGISYFTKRIPKTKLKPEIHASIPFLVPYIIKTIVAETYSLSDIGNALRYGELKVDDYSIWLEIYRTREIPLPPEEPGPDEANIAKIVEVHRLENILKEHLLNGMNKSLKRKQERDIRWERFTDTVRLYLAHGPGDDFKLEICLCSSAGRAISEERMRTVEGLRNMLGDCLFKGMKASKYRKEEEKLGMSVCTRAVDVSFPKGDDGGDCTVEVMLDFDTGRFVWDELYPR